ncbi:MAG: DDE-type integrase/transposase/recombinase [Rhodospirillales bacterium]|jgi:transposase-like protein
MQWRWHIDEVFVKIRGENHYLWRAIGTAWDEVRNALKPGSAIIHRSRPG